MGAFENWTTSASRDLIIKLLWLHEFVCDQHYHRLKLMFIAERQFLKANPPCYSACFNFNLARFYEPPIEIVPPSQA